MTWREDVVAQYKKDIERMRGDIAAMQAGTFQMRSFENGQWVVTNERHIAHDTRKIAELEAIIARAEEKES